MKSKDLTILLIVAAIGIAVYFFVIKEKAEPAAPITPPSKSPIAPPKSSTTIVKGEPVTTQPIDNSPLTSGNLVYAIIDKVNIRLADNDFGNVFKVIPKSQYVGAYWRAANNGYIEIKITGVTKPIYVKRTDVYLGQK